MPNASNRNGVLFRSRIEITGVLEELARDGALLAAEVGGGEQLFLTRVLHVDPGGEFFVIGYSEEKKANNALLEEQSVKFWANEGSWRIEFTATRPSEMVFDGVAAVRFVIPEALIQSHHREHPRFRVRSDVSLRCIADGAGVAPFEARIVDISRGGIGGIVYESAIKLAPGTVLKGCKIVLPSAQAIVADLEVRYTISITQPDGSLALRSGVRFLVEPKSFGALLKKFIVEFDEDPEEKWLRLFEQLPSICKWIPGGLRTAPKGR